MMHDKTVAPLTSNQHRVTLHWIQRGPDVSLANRIDALSKGRQPPRFAPLINHLAARTQRLGASDIWSGYKTRDLKSSSRRRLPNDIRVSSRAATFEAALARMVVPGLVVEIGSGFGVSGMYWLSALDEMGAGRFISFEPNLLWHGVAAQNYSFVSARGQTVQGTFEENAYGTIPCSAVDILSIDAIHTPEAVSRQISLALPLLRDDSWVLIDDIRFSSQMYDYWRRLAQSPSVMSFEIDTRVGVLRGLPRVGLTQQQLHIITDAYKFQHADRD
ncbi:hypothetical protein Bpro_4931 (plasmid) [Polaromonas sp. JS666]|nr:hypothetical protein Bpro_4931 [Polaromonas sp. JS666]